MARSLKRMLLGNPLDTEQAADERLSNPVALAIFSSDALSSVAYATEEILLMLLVAGSGALLIATPVAAAIGVLLIIVVVSYRQTIKAYPCGGGAYVVAKENLGTMPGLVAGGSLLVDYILTVAVSISAGTAAITSALPGLSPYRVPIALVLVGLVAVANLRGVKESGRLFAGPPLAFIGLFAVLIVVGLIRSVTGGLAAVTPHVVGEAEPLTLFLVLMAFASGCSAMTGVEAVANGVQAFREPAATNARKTLTWMAGILLFLFLGTTLLARQTGVAPIEGGETVVSQMARTVFGTGVVYYLLQGATALILILAANTSYAGFPRLSSFMAQDGFMPTTLQDRGHRLVHSRGILLLTATAMVLIVVFGGITSRLIPLYAVGVFASFTLSQAGMVVHWWRTRGSGWQWSMAVNSIGAVTTSVVTLVIAAAKFSRGAWIVLVIIPVLVGYFLWVHRQYRTVSEQLQLGLDPGESLVWDPAGRLYNHVVVLVGTIDRRILPALRYALSMGADAVDAVFVDSTGDRGEHMKKEWERLACSVPLTVLESPFREIIEPIRTYIRSLPRPAEESVVTVLIPQFVPRGLSDYGGVYVYRAGLRHWIKRGLFAEPNVIVADVPYYLKEGPAEIEIP